MKIKNATFTISAVRENQYPKDDLKQVVLVGKSNVGLARTSSEPGKTRLINFYKINATNNEQNENEDFYFVDLPGYGFSKMSKSEQVEVGKFIEEYLVKSKQIGLVIFLIDIRHKPTANDKLMYDYIIKENLPCIIIANKADKIAITKVDDTIKSLQKELNPLNDLKFMPFSSERKIYSKDVEQMIENFLF